MAGRMTYEEWLDLRKLECLPVHHRVTLLNPDVFDPRGESFELGYPLCRKTPDFLRPEVPDHDIIP